MFERLQPRTQPQPPQEEPLRYRDVLFIIFSIALTAFLLICAVRGGNFIFDSMEKQRQLNIQETVAEQIENCIQDFKDVRQYICVREAQRNAP